MSIVEKLMSRVDGIVFPDTLAEEAANEIVRLRKQASDFCDMYDREDKKAADEIERLEKALNYIVSVRGCIKRKSAGEKWCIEIAKKTLNGQILTP